MFEHFRELGDQCSAKHAINESSPTAVNVTLSATNDGGLGQTFLFTGSAALAIFIFFLVLRTKFREFYCPRFYVPNFYKKSKWTSVKDAPQEDNVISTIANSGLFGWIIPVIRYSDDRVYRENGIDAYLYLLFQKSCFIFFCVASIYTILVLLPINATSSEDLSGVYAITFSKIDPQTQSQRAWGVFVGSCLFSFMFLYISYKMYQVYTEKRQEWRKSFTPGNYTIIIERIPKDLTTEAQLMRYLSHYFVLEEIYEARFVIYSADVDKLLSQIKDVRKKLHRARYTYDETGVRPTTHKGLKFNQKIDAIDHYTSTLRDLLAELREKAESHRVSAGEMDETQTLLPQKEQAEATNEEVLFDVNKIKTLTSTLRADFMDGMQTGMGEMVHEVNSLNPFASSFRADVVFVTFRSIRSATIYSQTRYSNNTSIEVLPAPSPEMVYWKWLKISPRQRLIRWWLVVALCSVLVLTWAIPVALLGSLFMPQNLCHVAPRLTDFVLGSLGFVSALITSYLPNIATLIFMQLLIPILSFLAGQQAPHDRGSRDRTLMFMYFAFTCFSLLAPSILGTTSLKIIDMLSNTTSTQTPCKFLYWNPDGKAFCTVIKISNTVGSNLPAYGMFFVNYVLSGLFIGSMLSLSRVTSLVPYLLQLKYTAKTPTDKESLLKGIGGFSFGTALAVHLSFTALIFTFILLVPLMSLVGVFYFAIWHITDKYNIICVYRYSNSYGGKLTTTAYTLLFISLMIMHLTIFAVFLALQLIAICVAQLVLITVICVIFLHYRSQYESRLTILPLDVLHNIGQPPNEEIAAFHNAYVHPSLIALDSGKLADVQKDLDQTQQPLPQTQDVQNDDVIIPFRGE